jgi:hypothetical protein
VGLAVRAFDEVPGRGKTRLPDISLATERVTAGELIRRRVEIEIASRSEPTPKAMASFHHKDEVRLNPERTHQHPRAKTLQPAEQITRALDQFSAGKILLLVDGRQIEGVDTRVVLAKDSEITFLRLVPLVGG